VGRGDKEERVNSINGLYSGIHWGEGEGIIWIWRQRLNIVFEYFGRNMLE
jgi:hypothetical protein